ncbi:MAG: YceI family protein [Candidatus Korobacteraceae bacterium]
MLKRIALIAMAGFLTSGFSGTPSTTTTGSWQVDSRQSSAQVITDGTTDFGKKKVDFTLGFARVNGTVKLDDANPANSKLDFSMYPATTSSPVIAENGNFKQEWLANVANNTLVCFHSKSVVRTPDGKLQATGELVLTRVDRNVQLDPTEAYSGPTYGPPMIHRVSREAMFVFDLPSGGSGQNGGIELTGNTKMSRENFPQLVKAVISTNWPPLVQDEHCVTPAGGTEDYRGYQCSGTFMEAPGLPPTPTQIGEDFPGASNFNAVVGNQLTIMVRLHLAPKAASGQAGS